MIHRMQEAKQRGRPKGSIPQLAHSLPGEEWRAVAGTSLEVSNLGRMRGPMGLRKPQVERKRKDCYLKVGVGNHQNGTWRNVPIHVAVCEAWHGPKPSPEIEVCHRDGNCQNNRADNLKWGTRQENEAQRREHGGVLIGSQLASSKLTEAAVVFMREARAKGATARDLAKRFGVDEKTARNAIAGRTWAHVENVTAAD